MRILPVCTRKKNNLIKFVEFYEIYNSVGRKVDWIVGGIPEK